jgi:hypothetical protein
VLFFNLSSTLISSIVSDTLKLNYGFTDCATVLKEPPHWTSVYCIPVSVNIQGQFKLDLEFSLFLVNNVDW